MLNPIKSPTFPHDFCPREAGLRARHLQLRLRLGYSIYLAAKLGRESVGVFRRMWVYPKMAMNQYLLIPFLEG